MSYILDALRRSQAERERGQVPGLNAQPTPPESPAPQRAVAPGMWLGLGLAIGVVAAAAVWFSREPVTEGPAVTVGAVGAAGTPMPAPGAGLPSNGAPTVLESVPMGSMSANEPALIPPTAPVTPEVSAAPLPRVVSAPATGPSLAAPVPDPFLPVPVPAPPPTAGAAPTRATLPAGATPAPSPAAATGPTAALVSPASRPSAALTAPAAVPAAPARPVPLGELNAEQRRDLPPMTVGGSIWSDNPASRFVIVNGQVVREGEAAAPGVVLERIGQKALVLRWRELRVEVSL